MKEIPLQNIRKNYPKEPLLQDELPKEPFSLVEKWLLKALKTAPKSDEPNAMTLCTVDSMGRPSCREILLKGFDNKGFTFFTNYGSKKARDIEKNPFVAASFFWPWLHWQLRIEGKAYKIAPEESEKYFNTRPVLSQIAAVISKQSQTLSSRDDLIQQFNEVEEKDDKNNLKCPAYWGGFQIIPTRLEFWQGQEDRLHDRILYEWKKECWIRERLYP